MNAPDRIVHRACVATLDPARPDASAVAIAGGRFVAVGGEDEVLALRGPATDVIDAGGRTLIPGLIDSHLHVIRGGLHFDLELRWDGIASLAEALRMLRRQAEATPPPHWVRVVGGWTGAQFAERRLPTLDEINAAAPDTPVFVLHLYDRALLNRAALRVLGLDRETPAPPGGVIERDASGRPTGLLVAKPSAAILYGTLARAPRLDLEQQRGSTLRFLRELNRLGVTSAIDAGGGWQNYPDDYAVVESLARERRLTLRMAYNLFTQRPREELDDFRRWSGQTAPGRGDDWLKVNGAGEMLVFSAADFEDFVEPRPDLPASLEDDLHGVVDLLVRRRWPFRIHATYDESITRFLEVFERVDRAIPFAGLRWFLDHAETISPRNLERVAKLRGGIAIQHRMAYQGEAFRDRYGAAAAADAPPIRRMLEAGLPVGAGTDATRVASYNPWISLHWLVSGRTVGGAQLAAPRNRLDRVEALRLWTSGSAWFSGDEAAKGRIAPGQLADAALLSADYFRVPEPEIARLESVLTLVGGEIVHAACEFAPRAPPLPPPAPDWAPRTVWGGRRIDEPFHPPAGCPCAW